MELAKILALAYRDFLIIRRSKWRLVEIFYFPIVTIIIWGLFAVYAKTFAVQAGLLVLIVNIFWNFAFVAQSTVNMQIMQDSWSGSLKQLLLSGVSEVEYVTGRLISATIVSILVLVLLLSISSLFGWNPLTELPTVIIISLLTLVTSLALAVLITGLIIMLGRSYAFLAWTALQAFILLSAPFFPKEIFPGVLRYFSEVMPYTHIFEAARNLAAGNPVFFGKAIIVTIAYSIIVWPIYIYLFKVARRNGNLVRIS